MHIKSHGCLFGSSQLLPGGAQVVREDNGHWPTDASYSNQTRAVVQLAGVDELFAEDLESTQANYWLAINGGYCLPRRSAVFGFIQWMGIADVGKVAGPILPAKP